MEKHEIAAIINECGLRMVVQKDTGGKGKEVQFISISHHGRNHKKTYLGSLGVLSKLNEDQLRMRIAEKAKKFESVTETISVTKE